MNRDVLWIIYSTYPDRTGGRETWINETSKRIIYYCPLIISLREFNQKRNAFVNGCKVYRSLSIPPPHIPYGLPLELLWNTISLTIKALLVFLKNQDNITAVHVHLGLFEALPGVLIKKMFKVKLIVQIHGFSIEDLSAVLPLTYLWKSIFALSLKSADVTIFVGRRLEEEARRHFKMKRSMVVYPGVDPKIFSPEGDVFDKAELLRQANLSPCGSDILLCANVANMRTWIKGQDLSVKAVPSILKRYENFYLLFVGRGDPNELRALARSLGVEGHIGFLGERTDIPRILRSVDIIIHPSRLEGVPIALLEAMACGKPVVATRVGGIPEIIEDGVNGFLVDPDDSDALASKVISLLSDRNKAQEISKNNRLKILTMFTWDRAVSLTSNAYRNSNDTERAR